jgi:hypothetical protein
MSRVRRVILGVLVLVALAAAAVACSGGDDEPEATPPSTNAETAPEEQGLEACGEIEDDDAARECYAEALSALFEGEDDPSGPLEEAAVAAYSDPTGRLLGDCHGLMHTVGREFAAEQQVTLASLMTYLPQSNEPGCTAGFAHGLVTGVAPQIDLSRPAEAASVCDDTDTRYQRYSCIHGFGHAFMRLVREDLDEALRLCAALGDASAPDCAQGSFHDYWFAVIGADDTEPPEEISDDRASCAARRIPSSCARAGTARSSTIAPTSPSTAQRTSRRSAPDSGASSGRRASRLRRSWAHPIRAPSSRSAPSSKARTP